MIIKGTVIPNNDKNLVVVEVVGAENGGKGEIHSHSIVAFNVVNNNIAYPITMHKELSPLDADIATYNFEQDGWTVIHKMGSETESKSGCGIDALGDYLVRRMKG